MYLKILSTLLILLLAISCTQKTSEDIPLVQGKIHNSTNNKLYVFENNNQPVCIDTILINENGSFSIPSGSISKPGFFRFNDGIHEGINLFIFPNDSIHLVFDQQNPKLTCKSRNSRINNTIWTLERNTNEYKHKLESLTQKMIALTGKTNIDSSYQMLYQQKDSITELYRKKSLDIVKGESSPICTYFMLNQKVGNTSLFTLEKDMELFMQNAELLANEAVFGDLFSMYSEKIEQAVYTLESINKYGVGKPFPSLDAKTNWNKTISLSQINGNPSLVIFWNSEHQVNENIIPAIKKLSRRYQKKGLRILMVAYQKDKIQWLNNIKKFQLPYWHTINTEASSASDLKEMGVRSLPYFFLVSKEENIIARDICNDKLEENVQKAIEKY
jgi:thiol-disulfide isomerase/thioredoxin